jgi:hypothetical protein
MDWFDALLNFGTPYIFQIPKERDPGPTFTSAISLSRVYTV